MPYRSAAEHEDVPRPVVGIGNDYPPSFELAEHRHRRGQAPLCRERRGRGQHAAGRVGCPAGARGVDPRRHATCRAHGRGGADTQRADRAERLPGAGGACRVVAVSPLLRRLLLSAAEIPVEYDEGGRDGLVMRLLVAEIDRAPVIPIAVPFPRHAALAARCHAFLERPRATATIDQWADALAMNRRRFTRLFRRETGMSFAEWRQQACLSVALPRLAAGEPITTIALDLGYDGPASFSTMFKRALGVPPSRYRP